MSNQSNLTITNESQCSFFSIFKSDYWLLHEIIDESDERNLESNTISQKMQENKIGRSVKHQTP